MGSMGQAPLVTDEPEMLVSRMLSTPNRLAVLGALAGPLVISLALVPFRDNFANTNAALILVLVIVAVASTGNRVAGVLAALSAALWFDVFLTRPYGRITITDRVDLETTVLLLAVGVGVTELAAWGHRQRAHADRDAGYLDGIRAAAEAVAAGSSSQDLIDEVARQLTRVLGLRACRFQYGVAGLDTPLGCVTTASWSGNQRCGTSSGTACRPTSTSSCSLRAAVVCRAASCSPLERTRTPRQPSGWWP